MATPKVLADAAKKCQQANLEVEDRLLKLKIEDGGHGDLEDDPIVEPDVRTMGDTLPGTKGLYKMTLGMAQFLATNGCCVEELDLEFNNPPHEACINFGGCDQCIQQHGMEEEDQHAAARVAKCEPVDLTIEFYNDPHEELKHNITKTQIGPDMARNIE